MNQPRMLFMKKKVLVRRLYVSLALPVFLLTVYCTKKEHPAAGKGSEAGDKITLTVNLNDVKQTIHSFGASDCWTGKFIGKWKDVQKKKQIADWLFSMDTIAGGSPRGIGLSLWRFNIGGGSYEQGDLSNIPDEWRREESFMDESGSYDWSKQEGQQWFLEAAKQRGVKYTLGFSLTPPVFMTKNGKAYNGPSGTKMNIQPGKLEAYADFLAQVTKHFKFDFLSPVNEPQWAWGKENSSSQEGTQVENPEISSFVKLLSGRLNGSASQIVVGEAGQLDFLYTRNEDNRGDQVSRFFSQSSSGYIGHLPNVARIISAHSYFTTCPDNNLVNVRQQVAAKINQVDPSLKFWQTEFGILGNICGQYQGGPRNTGIDYGLYVAKVIHHDLVIANAASWQWWLAMSPYDYSDALVYINAPSGEINVAGCKEDGIVQDSKQLWAFGNYARFIRPGMKRVDVSAGGIKDAETAARSLMVSAYKDEEKKILVMVIVNPENEEKTVTLKNASGALSFQKGELNAYITDAVNNLKRSVVQYDEVKVPARSVITLTGNYK